MEIYLVTEVSADWHNTTVHSSHEDAYRRVQYLLKGFKANQYFGRWRWKAYTESNRASIITIEKFIHTQGTDEWVFKY